MYEGPWVMVRKPPNSQERIAQGVRPRTLIHDDDSARALGYKAGIVGGLTLLSVTSAAIPASLGHAWYQGGVYSVRHRSVGYEGEVRVVWEVVKPDPPGSRKIAFHLENREGNTSTYGWASTTEAGREPVAPWERDPARKPVGSDAAPDIVVGSTRTPFEIVVRREDVMEKDQHWWYRVASPWGDPVLSPLDIASVFYHGRRINPAFVEPRSSAPVRRGMDAGTDLVVYEPLFLDRTYVINTKLCDKWQTEKTVFTSTEYTYQDKETGRLAAAVRTYGALLIRDVVPVTETR